MAKPAPIPSFTDLYEHALNDRSWLGPFLSGHLMVEFMLRKLIAQYDTKLSKFAESLNHRSLIDLNHEIGSISEAQREVLLSINSMRNKLAHEITFNPSMDDMKDLWRRAASAFTDLTDGLAQGLEEMEIEEKIRHLDDWVFSEFFVQISYDLHHAFVEMGGDHEMF